jgi:hypothetical protein
VDCELAQRWRHLTSDVQSCMHVSPFRSIEPPNLGATAAQEIARAALVGIFSHYLFIY